MGIQTLITRLRGRLDERKAEAVTTYRDLVRKIADGHEPDAAALEQALRDGGKSLDDLRRDAETILSRREWMRVAATISGLREQRAALLERHAEAQRDLTEKIEIARAGIAEIERELEALEPKLVEAAEARGALLRTAIAPPDFRNLKEELAAAVVRLQELDKEADLSRPRVKFYAGEAEAPAEAAQARHAAVLRRKAGAEQDVADLRARVAEIEESLLCQ